MEEEKKKITLGELIAQRRKELEGYIVEIDKDPSTKSPGELYRQESKVKAWSSRCTSMYSEAVQMKSRIERDFKQKKFDYNRKVVDLQLTDKNIQGYSNKEMRQAAAERMLKEDGDIVFDAEKRFILVDSYLIEVGARLKDLYKTLESINNQMTKIKTMIYLGEIRAKGAANKAAGKLFDEQEMNDGI